MQRDAVAGIAQRLEGRIHAPLKPLASTYETCQLKTKDTAARHTLVPTNPQVRDLRFRV